MVKQRLKNHDSSYKKFEKYSDSSDAEENELFVREKHQRREIPTVDKFLEEGDTLQSLAIRYRCTIEDLKRFNNIHKDNEIYARRSIKVPHRPFTAALVGVHSGTSSPNKNVDGLIDIDSEITPDVIHSKLNPTLSEKAQLNEIIFNSTVGEKSCAILSLVTDVESSNQIELDEEVCLLPQEEHRNEAPTYKIDCSGADGDISWKALIACIVVLIFAVPLIYVFYIAEHPEKYHQHS